MVSRSVFKQRRERHQTFGLRCTRAFHVTKHTYPDTPENSRLSETQGKEGLALYATERKSVERERKGEMEVKGG